LSVYLTFQRVRYIIYIRDDLRDEIALIIAASKLEALLQDEKAASERYRLRIHHLENETQQRSTTIEELSRRERGFEEKCREQVRGHNS
jgi:hypothetical protein